MASFDAPPAAAPVKNAPAPAPAMPDPELLRKEIQRLHDAALASGQAEGYAAGHTQGLEAGTDEGYKAGHQQGYEAGFAAGHASGREQAQQETAQLHALAQECAASIASIEAEMGQALISLAIKIAEQVLRSTLDAQPEKILDVVRDVTQLDIGREAMLTLRVNPADLELVQAYLQADPGASKWRLAPDASIARGGCIAETALGSIDATLQTRWLRVTSALGHKAAPAGDAQ
ncbi:flagellar assembly protein FliH [Pollutimonas sp. M17]|uniref:flagellar assembly protein FliH n=1 Tax=Pollutimonas sp. M17 TaxID=2962065 RepID=UPI0021F400CE|nr:flagellar assembly protein FliH [Pollutimonas sp. M17]UYO94977.1 flagellar assembly protein FliH [Pollutimonas sp. M17]